MAALLSDAARTPPGVTLDDPFYPLRDATNEPPPVRPGGPPIWLGGQRRRGIALAVRYADGWPMPGNRPGDVAYFAEKRDEIRRALEAAGRDPGGVHVRGPAELRDDGGGAPRGPGSRRPAFVRAGAGHVILGPARDGRPGRPRRRGPRGRGAPRQGRRARRRMIRPMTDETAAGAVPGRTRTGSGRPPVRRSRREPHPWAEADRPRGLDAPFAPGGEDEAPPERVPTSGA